MKDRFKYIEKIIKILILVFLLIGTYSIIINIHNNLIITISFAILLGIYLSILLIKWLNNLSNKEKITKIKRRR